MARRPDRRLRPLRRQGHRSRAHQRLRRLRTTPYPASRGSATCHIIATWHQYAGAVWISDDQDSLRFADTRGIAAWETLDIMRAIASDGDLTPQAAYALMLKMADAGRALTLPRTHRDLQD